MNTVIGSCFGPYEITARLGAGGMGEVYRAKDPRLRRDVALKILLESAATDPVRQRRFAQEAIAASALNHPNIVVVYDVGVERGLQYLVSELIDGVPLRQEVQRGRMPLARLLDLAVQLAGGLSAAHSAGIVHRDLKPENIMITRDGRVKILDFGLAKAWEDDGAMIPSALTETAGGLLVGTVPYMSPEQASGNPVDFHSDQFSFGLVLYEMATGVHPFQRATAVQTLSAVIADEPRPIAELNPAIPVALRWVIERCLAKQPQERYAHTADLTADLKQIRDRLTDAMAADAVAVRPPVRRRRLPWVLTTGALVAAAFAFGVVVTPRGVDLTSYRYTPLATDAGYQGAPAWSPDGKTLAYVADVDGVLQIFTRSMASSMRAPVTRSRFDCHDPFWSPDGTRIYYHSLAGNKDALWAVSATAGPADVVVPGASRSTISPNGRTLVFFRESDVGLRMGLWFSSPPEAEPTRYTRPPFDRETTSDAVLRYSPDGSKLLIWMKTEARDDKEGSGFWLVPEHGGEPKMVLRSLSGPRAPALFSWLPNNRDIVVVRDDGPTPGAHLWLTDTETDRTRPLTITNANEGSPALAPDGRQIAFTSEATDFDLTLVPLDGSPMRSFLSSTRNELDPAWSPVAAQYAFVTDRNGGPEIWLRSEDGWLDRPLTTEASFRGSRTIVLGSLAFSPDGQRLAYQRFADDGYRIWISNLAGGSAMRLVTPSDRFQDAPTWSPDGDWIAFTIEASQWMLAKARVGRTGVEPEILHQGVAPFSRPSWSPDGRWILCQTEDGLLMVSPEGGGKRVLSDTEWFTYAWSADASRVYGLRLTDDLHHFLLASIDVNTGRETIVNGNLGAIPQANQPIRGFSRVRRDGFLTSIARVRSDIWLVEGFGATPGWLTRIWPFTRN